MRHPLWLVNSSLLALLFCVCGFIFIMQTDLPTPPSMKKKPIQHSTSVTGSNSIDIDKIVMNDLFYTRQDTPPTPEEVSLVKDIPTPPTQSMVTIPEEKEQPFLPPLDISLKGIILVSDESNNIAIIGDNKTTVDTNYKIGDSIEDAQLIRILTNKIILIRSNGQQETIYLNQKDILLDPMFVASKDDWSSVVHKESETKYTIDPVVFAQAVPNLSYFIDLLDLTTVYKDGKSIGCRVGMLDNKSLGTALGLKTFDIITKINDQPVTTTDERLKVFDFLTTLPLGTTFAVEILQDQQTNTIEFHLKDMQSPLSKINIDGASQKNSDLDTPETGILQGPSPDELEAERIAILQEKYKFAQTIQDMRIEQKKNMLAEGNVKRLDDFSISHDSKEHEKNDKRKVKK